MLIVPSLRVLAFFSLLATALFAFLALNNPSWTGVLFTAPFVAGGLVGIGLFGGMAEIIVLLRQIRDGQRK